MNSRPGKLLRLYVNEHDKYQGKPLYEAIAARCQELNLAGVTVFRGLEGFGETSELHRPHLLAHDQPIVITVIDMPDKTAQALPVLQEMMRSGVIAVTDVEVTFVSKGTASPSSESGE
jgi:PII-like signaling protein